MAININEFEVVPGDATPSQPASSSAEHKRGPSELPQMPSPWEIERLVEQQLERCERVWAH